MITPRHGRTRLDSDWWLLPACLALALCLALAVCLTLAGPSFAQDGRLSEGRSPERARLADASLHDVAFVDADSGWAVGDRGAIWHTANAGRHWELQSSGVDCPLNSVQFIDGQHGWAAGGFQRPHSRTSVGVLLHTSDGGSSWQSDAQPILPSLTAIRFFNAHDGWAWGHVAPAFATGLFVTDDGGRSWAPVVGSDVGHWAAADFVNPRFGALAGSRGQMSIVRRRAIEPAAAPPLGLRRVHRVRMNANSTGWLSGDGGLLLATADAGRNWRPPEGGSSLPSEFAGWAIAARGPHVWVAGSPGTRIWHSSDGGRIWLGQPTGQRLPIHALEFVDDQHGWAVGSFGLILATADGGRTWQRQHAGGSRAALLGLFSDAAAVPLEMLTKLSAQEGYLSAVDILNRADLEPGLNADGSAGSRASEALLLAGASAVETGWAFPVRQSGLTVPLEQLMTGWNRAATGAGGEGGAGKGDGVSRLEAHLVQQIRTWRPDVIVTHAARPQGEDPLAHAVNQLVLRAVEQAADPTREPDHAAQSGLEPWRVQKVFGYQPTGRSGSVTLAAAQLAPSLGCTLSDVADRARSVLSAESASGPANLAFQLLVDHVPQGAGAHDFFSGISLQPGGEARRSARESPERPDDLLRRSGQRFRNLQAILGYMERKSFNHDRMLAEMGQLVGDLEPDQAAELLYQMARQYQRRGRWDLALDITDLLITRYPEHALAEPALVWLVQCWASSEVGWHMDPGSRSGAKLAGPPAVTAAAAPASGVVPVAATGPVATGQMQATIGTAQARRERAVAVARLLERHWAKAFADPVVQFPLAAAMRQQSPPRPADKLYQNFASGRPHDAWWSCAAGRLWLSEPEAACPKPIWRVATAGSRPRLDGRLDEPLWQKAEAIELHSALGDDGDWPARALAAVDGEFLYLAVECREAPGCRYEAATGPRPRDPDLTDRDRVEIYLDLDCDWVTYFRLVIDHRGWAAEDCWQDASWNPQWFVAADRQAGGWTVEAALPLDALARDRPRSKDAWAVGVQRIVPQVGFQSWNTPAAVNPVGEGFGLLIFD